MTSCASFRDITRWNNRIEHIVAIFRIKQSRKEESNSDSWTGILVVLVFKFPKVWNNTTDTMLSSNTSIKIRYIADRIVEKWTKIAPILLIRQPPNIVKSMSISLYFVRTYYSESWIWSHFQNNTIVCSFSRKLRKKDVLLWNNLCLSLFCREMLTLFYECTYDVTSLRVSRQHRTQFSEDVCAFELWRYIAVQIWRVKELFVLGIVASTINNCTYEKK